MYRALCSIIICPVRNTLTVDEVNNGMHEAPLKRAPSNHHEIPLDFYYKKTNGAVLYGWAMMQLRHKRGNMLQEQFVHVLNFVDELYELYQRSCKGESPTQEDEKLCSAITRFLTLVHKASMLLASDIEASTRQYAFILPSQKYTKKHFVDTTLRPLLQTTPWLTSGNLASSKTVFYTKIDTYAYYLNGAKHVLRLERERKYLVCTLQKKDDFRRLMLTVNFTRAVYDPELISASGKSMTALGKNAILSLKLIGPTLSLEIPVEPTLAKMNSLAEFLHRKVFNDKEEGSGVIRLDEYNTANQQDSLIHRLIEAISKVHWKDASNRAINTRGFIGSLSAEEISRLSLITYGEIMQFFDSIDIPAAENEMRHYLEKYGTEETFQSIVVMEENSHDKITYMDRWYNERGNLLFAEERGQHFYWLRATKSIICLLEKQKTSQSTREIAISWENMSYGCAYKILNMVQLSNRLGQPVVIESSSKIKQEAKEAPAIQKEKLALIDRIQPYGYYVEANINCSNEIKLSLNQVIETTSEDGKLEKSTMAIQDLSYQTSDMYGFIFDTLWNTIDGHTVNSRCKSLQRDDATSLESYKVIQAEMTDAIQNSMESKLNVFQGLDEVIYHYNASPDCTCDVAITHRLVMNTGLLPYLKCVACEIVSSLKSKAVFGNYKISCLLVTGEFLYKWLEQGESTYGEFAWSQLQEEISAELYKKQLRVHLVMEKSIVLEDNNLNYKPLKLERYRQVFSKQFYLRIELNTESGVSWLYQDNGDHWIKVPFIRRENDELVWQIPLLSIGSKEDTECLLDRKFYFCLFTDPKRFSVNKIKLLALPVNDSDHADTALFSKMNLAMVKDVSSSDFSHAFPLEIKITPCSHLSAIDLRLRMGIDASANGPFEYNHIAYSERLTLEKM